MKKYKAFCLDLDGTVYRGVEPIREAVQFISNLQSKGYDPYYITNNSSMTPIQIQDKLHSFGIESSVDKIMTSAIAAAKYCKEMFAGATVMMIGEKGLAATLEAEGVTLVKNNPEIVIMGIDREISYEKLSRACLAIRAGAHFIATNSDSAFPTEQGLVPGNGAFVKLVEHATGQKPLFMGKPESLMLKYIQVSGGYRKDEMVMIGDNYDTDILAGIHFGIDTIHVEGGENSKDEVLLKEIKPTYLFRTLLDAEI